MTPAAPLSDADMYDRIVSAILDHQLPPGTKLVEHRLATAFGVARTLIRPVLVRLAHDTVLAPTHNRGPSISPPTDHAAREA